MRGGWCVLGGLFVSVSSGGAQVPCAADNAGLTLASGFCATIFADSITGARHLVVAPNGDVLVATRNTRGGGLGGIVALRDTSGDGRADVKVKFGANGGTGIALRGNSLYFGADDAILRYTLPEGNLLPHSTVDTIVRGLPSGSGHATKSIALGRNNQLFVNVGSLSNACEMRGGQAGSPGHDPCTELETRAGIWRFDASKKNQRQQDGKRFATGLRNVVALSFGPDGNLWGLQHGRDRLAQNWPQFYTAEDGAEQPAEVLVRIGEGNDFGWPYCYYDREQQKHVLAPEYGGDGKQVGRCDKAASIIAAYPGHWAPNGVVFYNSTQFPERYRGGVFIAFHGSWNRAPLPQGGNKVVFQPMRNDASAGEFEVFADGFAPAGVEPRGAPHRATGLAVGPDGSLYVSDDAGGRIWRVFYRGGQPGSD